MKPGPIGMHGYPVRAAVTTPETRAWEKRAQQLLVGKVVESVWISNSTIFIAVEGGGELSLAFSGELVETE